MPHILPVCPTSAVQRTAPMRAPFHRHLPLPSLTTDSQLNCLPAHPQRRTPASPSPSGRLLAYVPSHFGTKYCLSYCSVSDYLSSTSGRLLAYVASHFGGKTVCSPSVASTDGTPHSVCPTSVVQRIASMRTPSIDICLYPVSPPTRS